MKNRLFLTCFGIVTFCLCGFGEAQTTSSAGTGVVNVLTPQSPAFFLLGTNPQTISSPSSPAELGADILSGLNAQGNAQSGLAINIAPYMLIRGYNFTINDYQDDAHNKNGGSYFYYLLANTSLSFGTAKGTSSADKSLKAAVGFRTTLFDEGDARLDSHLQTCLTNVNEEVIQAPKTALGSISQASPAASNILTDWQKCETTHATDDWNKDAWDIGGGWSATSPDGTTRKFRSSAWGLFTSYGTGLGSASSYLILHGEYLKNEQIANVNKAGSFITQDAPTVSGKYIYKIGNTLHFDLTGFGTFNMPQHQPEQTSYGFSAGAEKEIFNGIWIQLTVGGTSATKDTKGAAFVLSQFSFSTNSTPPLPDATVGGS